jgi:hypothetical protein
MPDGVPVKLGTRDHTIVPQGIGRIRRKLVKLMQISEGAADFDGEIDSQLYDLLQTFIPDIAPLDDLLGKQEDEAAAAQTEPTLPQILDAVDAVYRVNGADRLVRLGKSVLGPDGLQMLLRREALTAFSDRSLSSPSPSGDSPSPTSTTIDPTLETDGESSPSPDSSISSQPESAAA